MLVRLVYTSRSATAVTADLKHDILAKAQKKNTGLGVTGILCIEEGNGLFLQVLEGSRPNVNSLYNEIVSDERHNDILLLDYAEIRERHYSAWRMGSVDINRVNRSAILRYSETATLDPYTMTGDAAVRLLEELASSAAVSTHA